MADEFDDIIALTDENGEETTWEHIGTFDVGGNCYVAMLSLDGEDECDECEEYGEECDEGEVWLMKLVTDENGEQAFSLIEDEEEYNMAAAEYTRMYDDGAFEAEE